MWAGTTAEMNGSALAMSDSGVGAENLSTAVSGSGVSTPSRLASTTRAGDGKFIATVSGPVFRHSSTDGSPVNMACTTRTSGLFHCSAVRLEPSSLNHCRSSGDGWTSGRNTAYRSRICSSSFVHSTRSWSGFDQSVHDSSLSWQYTLLLPC